MLEPSEVQPSLIEGSPATTAPQMDRAPPSGTATGCAFEDDDIRRIAKEIASLNRQQALQLTQYLKRLGISAPLTYRKKHRS